MTLRDEAHLLAAACEVGEPGGLRKGLGTRDCHFAVGRVGVNVDGLIA